MSKNLKIILVIIILVVLAALVIWFIPKKNVGYVVINDGYSSYESKIISNYQEYIEFVDYIDSQNKAAYDFNSNKYNEGYFDNKSLAIINIVTGSGMNKLNNIDISIIGNLLVCKADINYATGTVTADIKGKVLLIEIDKSVTKFKIEK